MALNQIAPFLLVFALVALFGGVDAQFQGIDLRIVTVPQAPFVYYDPTRSGNARWTGYIIDLWDLVLRDLGQTNINYTFYNSPDGRFGGLSNGNWTGMIKELLDGNADLALADFTITALRSTVTSWTVSFENIGLALMVPAQESNGTFWKFLNPFTPGLWLALVALSIAVSILMWISDRLSPYGWSKQARRKDRMNLSYPNSLLASLLLFLGNGNMVLGRSWGTRIFQLAYIAFALITVANYTANLAAFYTAKHINYGVSSFNDLATTKKPFGVMNGTSAQLYVSLLYPAQAARMVIYNNQTLLVEDLRTRKISAYVNDKGLLEYIANQPPCNLFVVGDVFNPATYGIAMPLVGYEGIRLALNTAILRVVESGQLEILHDRWFQAGACDNTQSGQLTKLSAADFAGAFALVGMGLAVCLLIVVIEWIFVKCYKRCYTSQAAKEMSDFFGGEAEDPIARWRATSIRGIFRPPPPELAHRRHIKKHVIEAPDDAQVPANPLVDLHLASTIHARSSMARTVEQSPSSSAALLPTVDAQQSSAAVAQPAPPSPAAQVPQDSPQSMSASSANPASDSAAKNEPQSPRPGSPSSGGPARRGRLLSHSKVELQPAPVASPPPPRRQRITASENNPSQSKLP